MTLQILNFKNYTDRLCNRLETVNEYRQYALHELLDIQFNMGDGIRTTQIVNVDLNGGNYLVVSENNVILSRWYIMETDWLRMGQARLHLKRDVIDDFIMDIKDQRFIIQRGMPPYQDDYYDPIVFNDEKIKVNRIKLGEVLVKDDAEYPWIIAYVDKQTNLKYSYKETFQIEDPSTTNRDYPFANIAEIANNYGRESDLQYVTNTTMENPVVSVYANAQEDAGDYSLYKYSYYAEQLGSGYSTMMISNPNVGVSGWEILGSRAGYCDSTRHPQPSDYRPRSIFSMKTSSPTNAQNIGMFSMDAREFKNYCVQANQQTYDCTPNENTLLRDIRVALGNPEFGQGRNESATGNILWAVPDVQIVPYPTNIQRYYRFSATKTTKTRVDMLPGYGEVFNNFYNVVSSSFNPFEGQGGGTTNSGISVAGEYVEYTITMDYIGTEPEGSFQIAANSSARNKQVSGLFDIICTPYVDSTYESSTGTLIQLEKETTLRFYQSLAALNSSAVYDIQIVPYGPKVRNNKPSFAFFTDSQSVVFLTNIESLDYQKTIRVADLPPNGIGLEEGGLGDAKYTKAFYITSMYRLCDPGYNGVFEFSGAANGGVDKLNVYVNLRPYNPFIHVAPKFGGLYGDTFDDARGLTCGSNFSITTKSDAWATYELNNKNYQQMFNRQIQNLEVTHDIQDTQQIWNAVGGTLSGAVSGTAT